jgi:hypothetical protein
MFEKKNFTPLFFVAVFGSEIRVPGLIKIRIRDKLPGSATLRISIYNYKENRSAFVGIG